jgi:hypothetical protein
MGYPLSKVIGYIVINDLSYLSIIILLSLLCQKKRHYYLTPPILVLCILYFADIELYQSLYRRLTFINIYKYIDESKAVYSFVSLRKIIFSGIILLIIWYIRHFTFTLYKRKLIFIFVILLVAFIPWISLFARPFDPFLDMVTSNVLQINQRVVLNRGIRADSYLRMRELFPILTREFDTLSFNRPPVDVSTDEHGRPSIALTPSPNIIVLISESLSRVDSLRSGGLFDRLKYIDHVQSQGLTLTNVVSNGRNTSDALASLLMGIEPLPTPLINDDMLKRFPVGYTMKAKTSVSPADNCEFNLICHAKSKGYKTIFLSNAQLDFQNNGPWLKRLGLEQIEGAGSEFFSQYTHYAFNSPPDEILYKRAIQIVSKQPTPFFLVLMTVSLHAPYILPDKQDRVAGSTLMGQLKYVDRTTSTFYHKLRDLGFFDNGIVLLVGDHRRMTPLEPEESNKNGIDSLGRVVACFLGKGFKPGAIDDTPLNHTDLSAMLYRILYGEPVPLNKLKYFNKGYMLGLNEPFTSHFINDNYGLIFVRRHHKFSQVFQLHNSINPVSIFKDEIDQKIATYLALSSGWLAKRQKLYENFR